MKITTKSGKETKKFGAKIAKEILKEKKWGKAVVVSLEGDLGAGKTTFTQGFAEGFGIHEKIQSPTFVILKVYSITPPSPPLVKGRSSKKIGRFSKLIHVDAYRLRSKDFKALNWEDFIRDEKNIILVEWGNKIKKILPKNSIRIKFEHGKNFNQRMIKII